MAERFAIRRKAAIHRKSIYAELAEYDKVDSILGRGTVEEQYEIDRATRIDTVLWYRRIRS